MCMRTKYDVIYAVIDIEESISRAAEVADNLQNYLDSLTTESYSEAHVLHCIRKVRKIINEVSSDCERIRKGVERNAASKSMEGE